MAAWTIRATSLKALSQFEWSPSGVCALVGPNGSGKSTALKLVHFVGTALRSGYDQALRVFGNGPLQSFRSNQLTPPLLTIKLRDVSWSLSFDRTESPWEEASVRGAEVYARAGGSSRMLSVTSGTPSFLNKPNELVLAQVDAGSSPELESLRLALYSSRLFFRADLSSLRMEGSTVSNSLELEPQGRNLFTVLRNWRDQSEHEERFTFVMEGMAECFPGFKRLDFVGWGPRQGAELPQAGSSDKLQPSDWSDGFLSTLCLLTAAATVDHGLLAIDELENSLHPELIVRVMELLRDWSRRKGVPILIATHSPVVLDQFRDDPERVFVMQPGAEKQPVALDTLKKRDWLQHFSIGDLYAHGEVGSPG
jgi:predicted ATPase